MTWFSTANIATPFSAHYSVLSWDFIAFILSRTVVPCSVSLPLSACALGYRCIQHNMTGSRQCLQSCYLENGGCSNDQVCYYERKEEECNQLVEVCFKTACTNDPSIILIYVHAHYYEVYLELLFLRYVSFSV